ncbi:MAG: hypothetical protein OXE99_03280, partial [Cellvibrionales bacterium]|nr:hypothetical protein [Cellvibrionales bacterium]
MINVTYLFFMILALVSCGGKELSKKDETSALGVYINSTGVLFSRANLTLQSLTIISENGEKFSLIKNPVDINLVGLALPVFLRNTNLPKGKYQSLKVVLSFGNEAFAIPQVDSGRFVEKPTILIDQAGDTVFNDQSTFSVDIQSALLLDDETAIVLVFDGGASFYFVNEKNNQPVFEFKPAFYIESLDDYPSVLIKGHVDAEGSDLTQSDDRHGVENERQAHPAGGSDGQAIDTDNQNNTASQAVQHHEQSTAATQTSSERLPKEQALGRYTKGKIEHINGNLITVKLQKESVVIDSHQIAITSQDEKLQLDANSFHLGQKVYFSEEDSVVRLLPSSFMVQVADSKDKSDRHEILLVNNLPAGKVFLSRDFSFDKQYVDALGFNPPANALLEIVGYHTNGITPSLKILDYRYLLINKVK